VATTVAIPEFSNKLSNLYNHHYFIWVDKNWISWSNKFIFKVEVIWRGEGVLLRVGLHQSFTVILLYYI